jgi:hypothetical protein
VSANCVAPAGLECVAPAGLDSLSPLPGLDSLSPFQGLIDASVFCRAFGAGQWWIVSDAPSGLLVISRRSCSRKRKGTTPQGLRIHGSFCAEKKFFRAQKAR